MKHVLIICTLCLCLVSALVGCSSSDGDSSSVSGASGSGSVATAYMNGGTVTVEHFSNGAWTPLAGASGSVSQSKLALQLPTDYAGKAPLIVSVTGSVMITGNATEPVLDDTLSRVVFADDDTDQVYISLFSTVYAKAFREGLKAGITADEGRRIGESIMESLFLSMGYQGSTITPENVGSIDPTTSDPDNAVDFEQAQQTLLFLLGLSDQNGLQGLDNVVEQLGENALAAGQTNGQFQVADFRDFIQATTGTSESIAALINNNKDLINAAVASTFGAAPEEAPVSGLEAAARAGSVETDPGNTHVWELEYGSSPTGSINIPFAYDADNVQVSRSIKISTNGGGAPGNFYGATATKGILLSRDSNGASPAAALTDVEINEFIYAVVPAGQPAGTYSVVLSNPSLYLEHVVTIRVLDDQTVAFENADAKFWNGESLNSYMEMDNPDHLLKVPNTATSVMGTGAGSIKTPVLKLQLDDLGTSATPQNFIVRVTLPEGLVFQESGNQAMEAGFTADGTNWVASENLTIVNSDIESATFELAGGAVLQAVRDLRFGKYGFLVEVFDAQGERLVAEKAETYLLTASGKDTIASIEGLTYDGSDTIHIGKPDESQTVMTEELPDENTWRTSFQTWYDIATGEDSANVPVPQAVIEHLNVAGSKGGFSDNAQGTNPVHQFAGTVDVSDYLTINTDNTVWAVVGVNGNQLNREIYTLKVWYEENGVQSSPMTSLGSVQFVAEEPPMKD